MCTAACAQNLRRCAVSHQHRRASGTDNGINGRLQDTSQQTLRTKASIQMVPRIAFYPFYTGESQQGQTQNPALVLSIPSPLPSPPLVTRHEVMVSSAATSTTHDAPQVPSTKDSKKGGLSLLHPPCWP